VLENGYNNDSELRKRENPTGSAAADPTLQAAVVRQTDAPRFVAPTHSGVDILKLLSELEDLVENTPKRLGVMFRFDDEKFHYLIMKIRANLPEEMKRASKLARDSERIVEESRENAGRILVEAREAALTEFEQGKVEASRLHEETLTELRRMHAEAEREARRIEAAAQKAGEECLAAARAQAMQAVAESEVLRQAQETAQEIQARADAQAQAVRQGADDYARDVLANLEAVLGKAVVQIQCGRELLERT